MKLNYCIALITLALLPITRALAQGSLLFIDGNKIECTTVDYTSDSTTINYTVANKTKIKRIPRDQFFSYTPKLGNELIFYTQDTIGENELNERQMRMFIIGQQDARTHYTTPMSVVGGALFGVASGFALTPLLSPLGTVPFIVINGSRLIKVNPKKVYNRGSMTFGVGNLSL